MPIGTRSSSSRRILIPGTILACLFLMVWAATEDDGWRITFPLTGGQYRDYYNLLVDGLLDGQLHMKIAPDASGGLPVHMDASFYEGKYYMYFGIVPALLTFLPYSFLTGYDMSQDLATLLLVGGGFLLNLRLYQLARRRYFPDCAPSVTACSIVLLAFGSSTPILLFDAGFYEVALAGGYLCISLVLFALYQAIHAERRAALWLAVASLGAGLAVGCRPTYILALPIVLVPLLLRLRPSAGIADGNVSLVRLLGAAVIPAGVVGLLLMAYNYGRFDDPFEFGFRYQHNALMSSGLPFARAAFMGVNLDWYYLTPPVLCPYFPYVFPINATLRPSDYYGYELIHGQWLVLPLALVCLAGVVWTGFRRGPLPAGLLALGGIALAAFGTVFLALLTFGFRANRYVTDFQPSLILALALAGGYAAAHAPAPRPWLGRSYRLLFCGLALALSLFNYLVGIQWMDHLANLRPRVYRTLAYYGNYPSYWLHQLGFLPYGPLRFNATFPVPAKPVREPLLATGTSGYTDILYANQYPDGRIQFFVEHSGYGGLQSALLPVVAGREQALEVELGSLYPPKLHPYFAGWDEPLIDRLKNTIQISLNGQAVLDGLQAFYDAPPGTVVFGGNPMNYERPFSGTISQVRRLPVHIPEMPQEFGLWRMDVEFPPNTPPTGQPLLASGVAGRGNLLQAELLPAGGIRFGFDEWGMKITYSPPVAIDLTRKHRIEVMVGPQVMRQLLPADWSVPPAELAPLANRLLVWLNGRLVWQTEINLNRESYNFVNLGINTQGFSTANHTFVGSFKALPLSAEEKKALLRRGLQAAAPSR